MSTEKNNQKKGVFEPVSAEEAKKIRAYSGGESLTSGSDSYNCPSGADVYSQCQGTYKGAECCYHDDAGNVVRGTCEYAAGPFAYPLKCISNPTEL